MSLHRPHSLESLRRRRLGRWMLKTAPLAVPAVTLVTVPVPKSVAGPVEFSGTPYTQDFNTLGAAFTAAAVANSTMLEASGQTNGPTGATGWYIYGAQGATRWGVNAGTATTGGFYGMLDGAGGKALGSLGAGSNGGFYGVVLQNTSGSTIDNVNVSFSALINRNPSTTVNNAVFSYMTSGNTANTTVGATGNGTFSNSAGTWLTNGSLNFSTPSSGTGAPGSQAAITPMFNFANPSAGLTGLGWANNTYLYLRWSETDEGGSDALFGLDNFSFSQVMTRALTWNVGSGVWDQSTTNWALANLATTAFANADSVTFSNSTGGIVTLSGAQAPISTAVSAASGLYTIAGTGAGDKITGSTSINKSGAGVLFVSNDNDFSGGTSISGGIVQIDGANRLGTGAITLNGGTLQVTGGGPFALTNNINIGASNGTIDTGGFDISVATTSSVTGRLTKSGGGNLTLLGAFAPGVGGGVAVAGGNLILNQATGQVNLSINGALTGNLVFSGPVRLNINNNAVISGTGGAILVAAAGNSTTNTLITQSFGNVGGTINAPIRLNSTNLAFAPGSWSGANYTQGNFTVSIGGSNGGGLILGAAISGASDVDFSASSSAGGGNGSLQLNAASNYTGTTTINAGTPDVQPYSIQLGATNALPTSTGVVFGTKSSVGAAILDLNGHNQSIGYLADGANATATNFLTIKNESASQNSVLTISGNVTPGNAFAGVIQDGTTNSISVVKAGSNTQTFTGNNLYSGGTSVTGGKLLVNGQVGSNSGTGTGSVNVSGTGTFGGTGRAAGDVNVDAGGTLAPGASIGNLTIGGNANFTSSTAKLAIEIGVASGISDRLILDNPAATLNFTTGSVLQALTSGFLPTPGIYTYTIVTLGDGNNITVDTEAPGSSTLGAFTVGGANTGPVLLDVSSLGLADGSTVNLAISGNDLVLTVNAVVPEPMSILLFGGAGMGVYSVIRRRRRSAVESSLSC